VNLPVPTCPECGHEFGIELTYSDIYGVCFQCMNCDEQFEFNDVKRLFKEKV
jgi:hypothetical protein